MSCSSAACGPKRCEWRLGFENLPEGGRQQAIHLVAQWGWYDQAIAVASSAECVLRLRTALSASSMIKEVDEAAAQSAKLSSEPRVRHRAAGESVSRRRVVERQCPRAHAAHTGYRAPHGPQVRSPPRRAPKICSIPSVNVPLGSAHFRELLDRFDGQVPVALAGYNAGPNAASRWLPSASRSIRMSGSRTSRTTRRAVTCSGFCGTS